MSICGKGGCRVKPGFTLMTRKTIALAGWGDEKLVQLYLSWRRAGSQGIKAVLRQVPPLFTASMSITSHLNHRIDHKQVIAKFNPFRALFQASISNTSLLILKRSIFILLF